jgi:hypothetical protein
LLEGIGPEILEGDGADAAGELVGIRVRFGWPVFLRSLEKKVRMGIAVLGSIEFEVFPRISMVKKAIFFMILLYYSGGGRLWKLIFCVHY